MIKFANFVVVYDIFNIIDADDDTSYTNIK